MKKGSLKQIKVMIAVSLMFVFCTGLVSMAAAKQDYPRRPIRIICPWGVGGGSDTLVRKTGDLLKDILGVPVVVSNLPGGYGATGLGEFMTKPADGYTVMQLTVSSLPLFYGSKAKYSDSEVKFLAQVHEQSSTIFVNPDLGWETAEEMLEAIKANPDKYTMASSTPLDAPSGERIVYNHFKENGYDMKVVVYSKPSERFSSVMGGHNDILYEQLGDVKGYVDAGKLQPLMHLAKERSSYMPNIQCSAEVGFEGLGSIVANARGYLVKAGTPDYAFNTLQEAMHEMVKTKEWIEYMESLMMDPEQSWASGAEMKQLWKAKAKGRGLIK